MKRNGFTFIELLLVIICIGVLVSGAGFSFKRAKISHLADTFVQELIILKTAIETYYESFGSLPEVSGKLSSFNALKNFWKPFNPDVSNIFPDAYWCGVISNELDKVYLQLYRSSTDKTAVFSDAEVAALKKKMDSVCVFTQNAGNYKCYIFQEPNSKSNSNLLE